MIKQLLKNSLIYPVLFKIRNSIRAIKFRSSEPYQFSGKRITKFLTRDPYSYRWFYPRYQGNKCHEPIATKKFIEAAQGAKVIADVGTNLGWFSCIVANEEPNSQVYGFELDQANYEICKKNIEFNNLKNVSLQNIAISNFDGTLTYFKSSKSEPDGQHSLNRKGRVRCETKALKLDTFFESTPIPDIMKIDVEGAEQLVLEGMEKMLRGDKLSFILIEVHPKWLRELGGSIGEVYRILKDSGFKVFAFEHRSDTGIETEIDECHLNAIKPGGEMLVAKKES